MNGYRGSRCEPLFDLPTPGLRIRVFMFRSSKFPIQVTGRFLTVYLLNAADADNVDEGVMSSETEYFAASQLQKIA